MQASQMEICGSGYDQARGYLIEPLSCDEEQRGIRIGGESGAGVGVGPGHQRAHAAGVDLDRSAWVWAGSRHRRFSWGCDRVLVRLHLGAGGAEPNRRYFCGADACLGGVLGGDGGLCRWLRPGVECGRVVKGRDAGFSAEAIAGLGLLLAAVLVLGMRSLLLAVKVVSDGPIYHLYFAARWWKAGRLFLVAAPFGENAATYFPANGDLWFTWLMASWGGDRLAKVGQAPFLFLAGLAAFGCARTLGAGRSASLVATCWFASSTPLLLYSFEPNVDTIFVAGYMVAAYFFLQAARGEGGTAALCLGALAAGEALGTKAVGVVFVPPLLALAAAGILFAAERARTKFLQCAVVLLVPLVTGGYWYFCNLLLCGNPLYPLELRAIGRVVRPGWYGPNAMQFSPYYIPFADWRALVDTLLAVLDPRLAPFWVAAIALGWLFAGGGGRTSSVMGGTSSSPTRRAQGVRLGRKDGLWRSGSWGS